MVWKSVSGTPYIWQRLQIRLETLKATCTGCGGIACRIREQWVDHNLGLGRRSGWGQDWLETCCQWGTAGALGVERFTRRVSIGQGNVAGYAGIAERFITGVACLKMNIIKIELLLFKYNFLKIYPGTTLKDK